jgi:PilZ domain
MQPSRHEQDVDESFTVQRQSPRCRAKLGVSLRLSSPWLKAEGNASSTEEIRGETRNLSETGLAVSVPSNRIGSRYLNVLGCILDVTLELPAGPVRMHATLKWCDWFLGENTTSYQIGLRISEMKDEEWVRLVRYVHVCL